MKIYTYILILFGILNCCQQPNKTISIDYDQIEEIRIDLKDGIIHPLDSLFSGKVSFVKLETRDDNLIGEISSIFFDDSLIFVVDANKAKGVFIFNVNGEYLSKIANYGNGPGEYSLMNNVFLVKSRKQIVVIDIPQRKKIYYSYSGKFMSEERLPFPTYNCEFLESGNSVYYIDHLNNPAFNNSENNVLVVTDINNKIIYSACNEFQSENFSLFQAKDFWKFGDELYFYPDFQDTLFVVTDTTVISKYYINILPDKMPNPSNIKDISTVSFVEDYLSKYSFFDGKFIELEDLTYLELTNTGLKIIYSHHTKSTYLCIDEVNTLYHFFDTPIARYGKNTIVVPTFAHKILKSKQYLSEEVPKLKRHHPDINIIEAERSFLDSLYLNMSEEDNPVLFFYELNTNL